MKIDEKRNFPNFIWTFFHISSLFDFQQIYGWLIHGKCNRFKSRVLFPYKWTSQLSILFFISPLPFWRRNAICGLWKKRKVSSIPHSLNEWLGVVAISKCFNRRTLLHPSPPSFPSIQIIHCLFKLGDNSASFIFDHFFGTYPIVENGPVWEKSIH